VALVRDCAAGAGAGALDGLSGDAEAGGAEAWCELARPLLVTPIWSPGRVSGLIERHPGPIGFRNGCSMCDQLCTAGGGTLLRYRPHEGIKVVVVFRLRAGCLGLTTIRWSNYDDDST